MPNVYDLEEAFKNIEDDLVNEIINGIKKTTPESVLKEDNITVWRANQLKELENFKKRNKKYFTKNNKKDLYKGIKEALSETYQEAGSSQQKKILKAVEKGLVTHNTKTDNDISSSFNGVNDRKLKALISETQKNLYSAETSAVRYAEDQYRQIIFNSNVYFNTGSGNLVKCIDKATKDFLSAGINNVEYKNGRRVNIQSYAEMALRTAEKRSYIQGEAKMRDEYGLGLVIVNRRGNACPKCMQFVGKIFNDDVYGNAKIDPKYPLLSEAIAGGLYHPNCKDVHTTYFPGITTERPAPTKEEVLAAEKQYALEQQQRFNERQIRKYKRLSDGTLDEEETKHYKEKVSKWQVKQRKLIEDNPTLRRKYNRESVISDVEPSKKTTITYKKFEGIDDINNFFDDEKTKKWIKKVSEDKITDGRNAINIYTTDKYDPINKKLRNIITEEEVIKELPKVNEIIDSIDKHIADFDLKDNITVYRGLHKNAFKTNDFKSLEKTFYTDKAFISTSTNEESSFDNLGANIKMIIDVPKGKGRGAYINDLSEYPEYEFLLARNSRLFIRKVEETEEGKIILHTILKPKD